jgi:hypothetical protein
MEQSFDSEARSHAPAPPCSPAAGVADIDDAGTLIGHVSRLADQMAYAAADIRRVVDDMVAARRMAQGEPSPTGTSSREGSRSPSPAPSQAPAGDAPPAIGGSGEAGDTAGLAHQPEPQVGDVWEHIGDDPFIGPGTVARVVALTRSDDHALCVRGEFEHPDVGAGTTQQSVVNFVASWRLVERDGKSWSREAPDVEPATDDRPEVVPADDDDLEVVEGTNVPVRYQFDWNNWFVSCLVARVRHEQARAKWLAVLQEESVEGRRLLVARLQDAERERDEAVARADDAEARICAARDEFTAMHIAAAKGDTRAENLAFVAAVLALRIIDADAPAGAYRTAEKEAGAPEGVHDAVVAERDALAARLDAVRAYCEQVIAAQTPGCRSAKELVDAMGVIRALLDGDGEAT